MKFTTKTEYGLVALIHMARNAQGGYVTIKEIADKEQFSPTYIEKILQRLKAAKIVASHQGKDGGYSLARDASGAALQSRGAALSCRGARRPVRPGDRGTRRGWRASDPRALPVRESAR